MTRKPMFASGLIVEDYEPLFAYWKVASSVDRSIAERATLTSEDFNALKSIVERGRVSLGELWDRLTNLVIDRIDSELAAKAFREELGVDMPSDTARWRIARILAGWIIEAGCTWGIVRIHRSW